MTELRLDPRNARKHSDRNKRQIKQSLETIGAGRSILADADGIVRAGNGVFAEWGDKPIKIVQTTGQELVVVQRTDLRGQDAIRAAALDNLVGDSSAFDYDAAILAEIARDDDVIRAIANEDAKLRELLRKENGNAEKVDAGELIDKAAQLQEKWQVRRGDVWQVGKHRLMCGDSTNKEDVARLMDGKPPVMWLTDPPYGVGYEYASHDDSNQGAYLELCKGFMQVNLSLGVFGVVTMPNRHHNWWVETFQPDSFLIWYDKTKQSPHKIAYLCKSELIFSFGKPKARYAWDTLEVQGVRGDGLRDLHTCPKPVELFVKLIEPQATYGEPVYDSFLGSGTTLVACEQTGRVGYGMEIEPRYVSVALERLANLGLQPQRLESQITGI